jgi:DNA polymerase
MIIGEGPGAEENRQGLAFIGPAGQLLTKMLAAINLSRDEVYITNVVKCRPPGNRVPLPEEVNSCLPYLRAQTAMIRPRIVLILGGTALKYLVDEQARITRSRGQWIYRKGVWMMPSYHPSALLRDPSKKREAWVDMQLLRDKLKEVDTEAYSEA